jgi:hypothetical protein
LGFGPSCLNETSIPIIERRGEKKIMTESKLEGREYIELSDRLKVTGLFRCVFANMKKHGE